MKNNETQKLKVSEKLFLFLFILEWQFTVKIQDHKWDHGVINNYLLILLNGSLFN
jgi:hypothetical protein